MRQVCIKIAIVIKNAKLCATKLEDIIKIILQNKYC